MSQTRSTPIRAIFTRTAKTRDQLQQLIRYMLSVCCMQKHVHNIESNVIYMNNKREDVFLTMSLVNFTESFQFVTV